jgi:receptor protein-tyrosine kinase
MRLVPNLRGGSADDAAALVPYLLARGATEADLQRVVATQRAQELSLSEALLHLGLVSEAELATARQATRQPETPSGGALPQSLLFVRDPFHPFAEQIRSLRAEVLRSQPDPHFNRLAVVGVNGGESCSTLAASLAVALAQLDQPTLLVDANLRQPTLHQVFALPREPGLADVLERGVAPVCTPIQGLPQLAVLTAGRAVANPLELLSSRPFGDLLEGFRRRYRHVVLDTAAAAQGADAVTVAVAAQATVTVARPGRTLLDDSRRLVQRLRTAQVPVLGVVLLKAPI